MSLLRELINEPLFKKDPKKALLDAAILVRMAGLEHLVTEATRAEVVALALAGLHLGKVSAIDVAKALLAPEEIVAPIDGGAALEGKALEKSLELARCR